MADSIKPASKTTEQICILGAVDYCKKNTGAVSILRYESTGITLYESHGHHGVEQTRSHNGKHFIAAYECDMSEQEQIYQIIIQTPHTTAVQQLIELIDAQASIIQEAIKNQLTTKGIADKIRNTETLKQYIPLDDMLETCYLEVQDRLAELNHSKTNGEALSGFMNAVYSKIDHWLIEIADPENNKIN